MTDHPSGDHDNDPQDAESQRPDPTDEAPAEGASRDIPAAERGKGQGTDTAYDREPAEGGRDES